MTPEKRREKIKSILTGPGPLNPVNLFLLQESLIKTLTTLESYSCEWALQDIDLFLESLK